MFWGAGDVGRTRGILINKREKGGIEKFRDAFFEWEQPTGIG
jgi:hypothetical protein